MYIPFQSKENEIMSFAGKLMSLEMTMLSEKKDKGGIFSLMQNLDLNTHTLKGH